MLVRTKSGKWRLPLLLPKEQLDSMISQLSLSVSMLPGWLLSTYLTWHTPCEWPLYLSLKQEPTPNLCSNIYVSQIKAGQGLLCILIKPFKNCLLSRFYLDWPGCSLINEELSIFLLRALTLQYSKIPYHWCNNCEVLLSLKWKKKSKKLSRHIIWIFYWVLGKYPICLINILL